MPVTQVVERQALLSALAGPATRFAVGVITNAPQNSGNVGAGMFFLEPDDYVGYKLKLRVALYANVTASTSDFTVGLHPITAVAGGATLVTVTAGAMLTPNVTFTAPALSTMTRLETGLFDVPVAGNYVVGVTHSATMAASSSVDITAQLLAVK